MKTLADILSPNRTNHTEKVILLSEFIQEFLAHLPYYALLLNAERHIIASNEGFRVDNNLADVSELFGKGPGDIFQCENSKEAGCGKSSNCQFCGIYRTITDCMEKNAPVSHTSRLMVNREGFLMSYEFKTSCSPLNLNGSRYYLLTLIDLSAENRKKDLERIFFHDILNMVSGLKGLSELMSESANILDMREYIDTLKEITERMSDTVYSQRDLMHAEMRELAVTVRRVSAREILNSVLDNSNFISSAGSEVVKIDMRGDDFSFSTDPSLLLRVLINMVKNALEAPNTKPGVLVSCTRSGDKVLFSVHNHACISDTDARDIFKPMQSTKGSGRGLGTYSIRLISENYLKGRVKFETHPEEGTLFSVEIPSDLED